MRIVDKIGFENWQEVYWNHLMIDLIKYFTEDEIELLRKFEIIIEDKVYTEYEYDVLKMTLSKYFKDEDMSEEELKETPDLKEIGVTQEEYDKLLDKFNMIDERYNKDI